MRKRGKGAITIDILEATLNPQKKMKIMYETNLNYLRFNRYLSDFLKKGFIEPVKDFEGNGRYRICPRGMELLAVLKKANELGFSDEE
jgi:predicted transcriptional regulator